MTYAAALAAVENLLDQTWIETPIAWYNVDFDSENVPEWIRLSIDGIDSRQVSMGSESDNCHRFVGLITIQVFTRVNRGARRASELADKLVDTFTGKRVGDVQFMSASARYIGQNGNWFQVNVNCEFYFHEFI